MINYSVKKKKILNWHFSFKSFKIKGRQKSRLQLVVKNTDHACCMSVTHLQWVFLQPGMYSHPYFLFLEFSLKDTVTAIISFSWLNNYLEIDKFQAYDLLCFSEAKYWKFPYFVFSGRILWTKLYFLTGFQRIRSCLIFLR